MGRKYLGGGKIARRKYRISERGRLTVAKNNMAKKLFVWGLKNKPCADCGISYNPWVMQFDHREPSNKKFDLSKFSSIGYIGIKEEISKCDVVCANCHAERTYKSTKRIYPNNWIEKPCDEKISSLARERVVDGYDFNQENI